MLPLTGTDPSTTGDQVYGPLALIVGGALLVLQVYQRVGSALANRRRTLAAVSVVEAKAEATKEEIAAQAKAARDELEAKARAAADELQAKADRTPIGYYQKIVTKLDKKVDALTGEMNDLKSAHYQIKAKHEVCEERAAQQECELEAVKDQNRDQQKVMDRMLGWLRHLGFRAEPGSDVHRTLPATDPIPTPPEFPYPRPNTPPETGPA